VPSKSSSVPSAPLTPFSGGRSAKYILPEEGFRVEGRKIERFLGEKERFSEILGIIFSPKKFKVWAHFCAGGCTDFSPFSLFWFSLGHIR
jgi:hypothetical protein